MGLFSSKAVREFHDAKIAESGGAQQTQCSSSGMHTDKPLTLSYSTTTSCVSFDGAGCWVTADGIVAMMFESRTRMFRDPIHICKDASGNPVAVVKPKTGMFADTYKIFRAVPSYEGQAPTEDPTRLSGDPLLPQFFLWAQVDTKRGVMGGTNTFRLVTGGTAAEPSFSEPVYSGEKLASMSYYAQVRNAKGEVVLKAQMGKGLFNINPVVEVSAGVDLAAVAACAAFLLPTSAGAAGALAGAGVV